MIAAEETTETARITEDAEIANETTTTVRWDEEWTMDGISKDDTNGNTITMALRVATDTTINRTIATIVIAINSCIPMVTLPVMVPTTRNVIELA